MHFIHSFETSMFILYRRIDDVTCQLKKSLQAYIIYTPYIYIYIYMLSIISSNRYSTAPLFRQLYHDLRHGMDLRFQELWKRRGPDLGFFNILRPGIYIIIME